MKTKRVLLAGATGYLGQYIAKKLIESEYPTRLIVRNKQKAPFDVEKFQIVVPLEEVLLLIILAELKMQTWGGLFLIISAIRIFMICCLKTGIISLLINAICPQ